MNNIDQEIAKCSKTLMLKEPFYGLFLLSLNKQINKRIETACVEPDGLNIKLNINPDFWDTLTNNTKLAVLKHELLHIVFFHLQNFDRFENKIVQNIAADLEINQYINDEYKDSTWVGLEYNKGLFKQLNLLPKQGTKYYYDKLTEELHTNPKRPNTKMPWENGNHGEDSQENQSQPSEQSSNEPQNIQELVDMLSGYDEHSLWDVMEEMNEAERKLIQKQIDYQLKEIAEELQKRNRGLIPDEMSDYINSLFEQHEPVIDWKSYLRRFANTSPRVLTKKTRYKPNKRFSSNPALRIKPQKHVLVAIDTSGSVSNDDLVEFFQEIYHIYKTGISITIIECDADIQRIYEYNGKREDIKVEGRGGTSFEPVMEYLFQTNKKYNNLIYLTDGAAPAPEKYPLIPMLWIHCSSSSINEDLPGKKIQIKR